MSIRDGAALPVPMHGVTAGGHEIRSAAFGRIPTEIRDLLPPHRPLRAATKQWHGIPFDLLTHVNAPPGKYRQLCYDALS